MKHCYYLPDSLRLIVCEILAPLTSENHREPCICISIRSDPLYNKFIHFRLKDFLPADLIDKLPYAEWRKVYLIICKFLYYLNFLANYACSCSIAKCLS